MEKRDLEIGEEYELGLSGPRSIREAAEAVGSVALAAGLCWAGVQALPYLVMVRVMVTMAVLAMARQHGVVAS